MNRKNIHSFQFGKVLILTLFLIVELPKTGAAEQVYPDGLTAEDIIGRMVEAYGTSKSYSDAGVVEIVFISADGRRTVKKPFKTAFVRPDHFRFEYKEKTSVFKYDRFIIHRQGKNVQTYWSLKNDLKLASLDRAVAAATGISGGSAITVPAMLLPDQITWRRAIRFHEPKRIDDDLLDGVNCFRIHDFIFGSPATLWIDKEMFLLRKTYREQEFEDFHTQTTTTYTPVLNGEVTDKMLEFNAPK